MSEPAEIEGFGRWYGEKQGDEGDLWHRTLIDPGLYRRLGELPTGSRVLDVGCGNGYIARRLARRGATVVGVDRSPELIELARAEEVRAPLGIRYLLGDAAAVPELEAGSMDVAVANMSLIDMPEAAGAIREVARLLRPGGRFVFSLSHPCFDVDNRSAWEVEVRLGERTVYRKVTAYRTPHEDRYRWEMPDGRVAWTTGYHRPLAWYAHELRRAGFVIVDLDEPSPAPEFVGRRMEREWIEAIPLHLVVEARRVEAPG